MKGKRKTIPEDPAAPELLPAKLRAVPALEGQYATIVCDPPWDVVTLQFRGAGNFAAQPDEVNHDKALEYPTLTVNEITAHKPPAARDAHLYLWTINAYIPDAYQIARAWGFKPSKLLVWIKAPMGIGQGGTFCTTAEFCLFARRGSLKAKRRVDRSWFNWPRGPHSAKPEGFQTLVESVSPGPYLEMFARRKRDGWDVWGNEV